MSTIKYSFSKPIPRHISRQKAVSHLHNPLNLITISPVVVRYEEVEPPGGIASRLDTKHYLLEDAIAYLPFGLWEGTKEVNVSYTNREDGVTVIKNAPFGFTFHELWSVREVNSDTTTPQSELNVDVEMNGSIIGVKAFGRYMKRSHENYLNLIVIGIST